MKAILTASQFALVNILALMHAFALIEGDDWVWGIYIAALMLGSVVDDGLGDRRRDLSPKVRWIYELNLYLTIPILILITVVHLHHWTGADPIGLRALANQYGLEMKSLYAYGKYEKLILTTVGTAYFYSLLGMAVGHELVHRSSIFERAAGKILLAFNMNVSFAIAHVYGHHRNVATYEDPGSARRNEYVLAFAVRSTMMQHIEAFQLEAKRLRHKRLPVLSWHNRAMRDQLYSLALLLFAYWLAGVSGLIAMLITGLLGSLFQKMVDYAQHYGLVRVKPTKFQDRHSWDCYRLLTSVLQFNLSLHSHHHQSATTPFWKLQPKKDAPRLPMGYQTASLLALIPPIWKRLVNPILYEWDNTMANEEERALIRKRGWEIEKDSWHLTPQWLRNAIS